MSQSLKLLIVVDDIDVWEGASVCDVSVMMVVVVVCCCCSVVVVIVHVIRIRVHHIHIHCHYWCWVVVVVFGIAAVFPHVFSVGTHLIGNSLKESRIPEEFSIIFRNSRYFYGNSWLFSGIPDQISSNWKEVGEYLCMSANSLLNLNLLTHSVYNVQVFEYCTACSTCTAPSDLQIQVPVS